MNRQSPPGFIYAGLTGPETTSTDYKSDMNYEVILIGPTGPGGEIIIKKNIFRDLKQSC